MFNEIRKAVRENCPLIHCITNPISVTQCANTILAVGGKPIMAEHPQEVEEITKTAEALLINLGNITDSRIKAMLISAKTASENNIPIVLDAVGAGCSELRRKLAFEIIEKYRPAVVKGNYSEIKALYFSEYKTQGVDANTNEEKNEIAEISVKLARKMKTIILASGKADIVSDGRNIFAINNGTQQLANVTGTGCMLGALCTAFISVKRSAEAVLTACAFLGVCGELAKTEKGNGTFLTNLMDNLSAITDENFEKNIRTEVIYYEKS